MSASQIVGRNIRRVRMARSMTQNDLAALIGKNQRTISGWEKGIRDPGSDNIRAIADALNIAPTELIGHNSAPSDTTFQDVVQGNDMHPEIQRGDTITVSTTAEVRDGDIVLVKKGNEVLCRRIYKHDNLISLLSLDQEKGLSIYDDSEVKIIGRVTEVRRKL